jgi:hypothetical protein
MPEDGRRKRGMSTEARFKPMCWGESFGSIPTSRSRFNVSSASGKGLWTLMEFFVKPFTIPEPDVEQVHVDNSCL